MSDGQADLQSAIQRLDDALASIETRVRALKARPPVEPAEDLFAERRGPSPREAELEAAARQASEALDEAAAGIRAALEEA